ncbi:hypothetical protein HK096_000728 [Nowakowskiella sp. JEL0078]|nr:hypothetical protein HK096_000728 [Nowakowskiella sp. JEL0078]
MLVEHLMDIDDNQLDSNSVDDNQLDSVDDLTESSELFWSDLTARFHKPSTFNLSVLNYFFPIKSPESLKLKIINPDDEFTLLQLLESASDDMAEDVRRICKRMKIKLLTRRLKRLAKIPLFNLDAIVSKSLNLRTSAGQVPMEPVTGHFIAVGNSSKDRLKVRSFEIQELDTVSKKVNNKIFFETLPIILL